jgi:hypothetical protein
MIYSQNSVRWTSWLWSRRGALHRQVPSGRLGGEPETDGGFLRLLQIIGDLTKVSRVIYKLYLPYW